MARPRPIIFDCDGVLVDSEPLAARAYERVYEKHGMPGVHGGIIAQCVGMKQSDIIIRIKELTGHQFPASAASDIWAETKILFSEELKPTPGIAAFLETLEGDRCVASSSSVERINHSLAVTGLAGFFGDAIYSSSMVKNGKPAPDIFLFAAARMGANPADCIVIEDSPFGIQGAVAAGMTAIGYTGGGHTYAEHGARLMAAGADFVCADWQEVSRQLSGLGVPA
ncbi:MULTISPECIES: HAD family phosphatase [unclassified Mesorhizobium]|uniref:HAD family hydrolase n=1 Tax=unclassified Mesorhizobium TaxID=325217 RepID=UPI00112B7A8C|nr:MULTISPECIES: HAD family phosphatase [unclassified Mesorhizobium]TPN49266.1 HAD family phosphatase [Mesorhizobium sp. B1-1-7]TPN51684.1 HAD family phosphatase [Mesorhizobium sp. B1-1-9]